MGEDLIIDAGSLKKYRTELPNIVVRYMGLDPYSGWLYTVMKSVAGEGGECRAGTRKLAVLSGMSVGQVSKSKQQLKDMNLIHVDTRSAGDIVRINDIWETNFFFFFRRKLLQEKQIQLSLLPGSDFQKEFRSSVQGMNAEEDCVHCMSGSVHGMNSKCSRYERKKEPCENNQKKKDNNGDGTGSEFGKDLQGPSFKQVVFQSVMQACGLHAPLSGRSEREVSEAVNWLIANNQGVSSEQIKRRVLAFSLWWTHREINGQKLGYPTPGTIMDKWDTFKLWCQRNLNGKLPVEETFLTVKA